MKLSLRSIPLSSRSYHSRPKFNSRGADSHNRSNNWGKPKPFGLSLPPRDPSEPPRIKLPPARYPNFTLSSLRQHNLSEIKMDPDEEMSTNNGSKAAQIGAQTFTPAPGRKWDNLSQPPAKRTKFSERDAPTHVADSNDLTEEAELSKMVVDEAVQPAEGSSSTRPALTPEQIAKRKAEADKARKKKLRKTVQDPVLFADIVSIIGAEKMEEILAKEKEMDNSRTGKGPKVEDDEGDAEGQWWDTYTVPNSLKTAEEVEVVISLTGHHGEGMGLYQLEGSNKPWILSVPFGLLGEKLKVRPNNYHMERLLTPCKIIEIITPSPQRNDSLVKCKYFGECGGCQFQMVSYEHQLKMKKDIVRKSYINFSGISTDIIDSVLNNTIESPKQYAYRTKITPHFNAVPRKLKSAAAAGNDIFAAQEDGTPGYQVDIGFDSRGTKKVIDIEECAIGSPAVNVGLTDERARVKANILDYDKMATILLRDSTTKKSFTTENTYPQVTMENMKSLTMTDEDDHVYVTDHKETMYERVGPYQFTFPAGSFFQNNNSVLVPLLLHVKNAIFPPNQTTPSPLANLIDTYCGSGLFSIGLSPYFQKVHGIEIDRNSIKYANENAKLNGVQDKCVFMEGDSASIFATVQTLKPEDSCIVIDPPRKGCDERFLLQLAAFRPATVVYVSCNVHTQSRDIGWLFKKQESEPHASGKKYRLKSLTGFDLFPQTYHVESVAVLELA